MGSSQSGQRRTALVTGASGGIGLELSRLLAADRYDLILVGRDRSRLEPVGAQLHADYDVAVHCESANLSEPGAAFQLWTNVTRAGRAIDVLINNAGAGLYGLVQEQDPRALERMVQLNVTALTVLTQLALPGMLQRRWGRILNVASVVGYQPAAPRMAAYYATKSYVLSFSKGVARELHGSGVSVTVLSPGPTDTAFDDAAGADVDSLYRRLPKMTAKAVARAGYRGMQRQSMVVIPGLLTKVLAFAGELPPRRIALEVNRLLWKPRSGRPQKS
jgi:short-subunit dehydrogenase